MAILQRYGDGCSASYAQPGLIREPRGHWATSPVLLRTARGEPLRIVGLDYTGRVKRIAFAGRHYLIPFGVFDPAKHLSGLLVAEYVQGSATAWAGKRVLEIGTGSGLIAGVLHDAGADVVATDISRLAVEAARGNLAHTAVEVRRGDLFEPVAGESFDVIVVNPPYEIGRSLRPRYRSLNFLDRLASQWPRFARELCVAFPLDSGDVLAGCGFDVELVATLTSPARALGIWGRSL